MTSPFLKFFQQEVSNEIGPCNWQFNVLDIYDGSQLMKSSENIKFNATNIEKRAKLKSA